MRSAGGRHRPENAVDEYATEEFYDPLEADTGGIPTFELRTPTIDQDVPNYAPLRQPSPSRRIAAVPAPFPKQRRDWAAIWGRAGLGMSAVGAVGAWVALFYADTADELLIAAGGISGCWILLGAISGWALGRD